jgi:2'-5' RNA ligase
VAENKNSADYAYGCLMLDLRINGWNVLLDALPEAQLYRPDEMKFGRQPNPHVTLLFGFHHLPGLGEKIMEKLPLDLAALQQNLVIGGCDCFENPKFDALILTLHSPELDRLNAWCRSSYPHTNSFSEYHPHATLAYLKPGAGAAYRTQSTQEVRAQVVSLTYSVPGQGRRRLTRAL